MSNKGYRSALLLLVVAAVVPLHGAAAAVASSASPCPDGVSVSLAAAADSRPSGREASYVVGDLPPGGRLERRVRVCNGGDAPLRVSLYSNAAAISGGQFLPIGSARAENELSRWTSVEPSTLVLDPDVPAEIAVTITVPADAEPGERYAVVYAEVPPAAGGSGVAVASRVGIRQYIFVRGDSAPATDFTVRTLTAGRNETGRPVIQAIVRNVGDRAIDVAGTLRLTEGPGGVRAGPYPATVGTTIAPGQSAPVEVLLDDALPPGPWRARLDLASGGTRRAAEAVVTFPDAAGKQNEPVKAKNLPLREDPDVVIPLAIGIFGLAVLFLLFALYRRRRKDGDGEEVAAG